MSFAESTTATISVKQLLKFCDAELARFIETHRSPNGDSVLPVDGWDKLPDDERERLAERLRAQERALAHNPTIHSRPLDLDQLDARLRDLSSDNNEFSPRAPPRSERSPTLSVVDWEGDAKDRETEAYNDLVSHGGRPVYPIDLLDQVFSKPEEYRQMLQSWHDPSDAGCWEVFQRQWSRWQDFRRWQHDNRDLEDDEGGFPAYLEIRKRHAKRDMTVNGYARWLAKLESDPSHLRSGWEFRQGLRERQRYYNREHGCTGFPEYMKAVKQRLMRHGFSRPFQLEEDPSQQDAVTTWIEYLNFEHWWLDKYMKSLVRLKPDHDKAWQELVDSNVLLPHETQEFVPSMECVVQHQAAEAEADEAVRAAEAKGREVYTKTQLDPDRLDIPQPKRREMLQAATAELAAAQARLEWAQRRRSLAAKYANATSGYRQAKKDVARQRNLVPWVVGQLRLMEAELAQEAKTADAGSDAVVSKKRRRPDGEEDGPRKLRRSARIAALAVAPPPSAAKTIQPPKAPRRTTGPAKSPVAQGTRRSRRVAATQEPPKTTAPPTRRRVPPKKPDSALGVRPRARRRRRP